MSKKFDKVGITNFWIASSERDWKTMAHLIKSKDYAWGLFLGHLVIEKLLKARIVKLTAAHPPRTHSLALLAKTLELSPEQIGWLEEITTFNLNVRYDDMKEEFYKKCTRDFANDWVSKIKTLRKWIKKKLSE